MMKMLTACTREVEDSMQALAELREQLEGQGPLLPQSAGFITCSYDFIETGVLQAVCQALPFPTVGCTTLTGATAGERDTMLLSLAVLTSQDCHFQVAETEPLTEDKLFHTVRQACMEGAAALPGTPTMALAFLPFAQTIGGEQMLTALNEAMGGVPVFGTIGCDYGTSFYTNTYTFTGGRPSKDSMALLLIHGPVDPEFLVIAVMEGKVQKQKAIITDSQGSVLKAVNGIAAADYLAGLGLGLGQGIEALTTVPFVVDYNDGTPPVARAIYMLTPQGYAMCGGAMPKGATLSVGVISYGDVLLTAGTAMERIAQSRRRGGLILFSCLGRDLALGLDTMAEINVIEAGMPAGMPYHLAYSGGELCPLPHDGGSWVNRFHNFSLIACLF